MQGTVQYIPCNFKSNYINRGEVAVLISIQNSSPPPSTTQILTLHKKSDHLNIVTIILIYFLEDKYIYVKKYSEEDNYLYSRFSLGFLLRIHPLCLRAFPIVVNA